MRLCREEATKLAGADAAKGDAGDMTRFLAIHFPHKLSPLMRDTLAHPRIVEVLTRAIGPNVAVSSISACWTASGGVLCSTM